MKAYPRTMAKETIALQKLITGPDTHHPSRFKHDNHIEIPNGGEPVATMNAHSDESCQRF